LKQEEMICRDQEKPQKAAARKKAMQKSPTPKHGAVV
jgi:hypothetical protein